jgi:hypothetical protein
MPIIDDSSVKGGYQTVTNAASRDAIPTVIRKAGMLVILQDTQVLYRLASNLTTWEAVNVQLSTAAWPGTTSAAGKMGGITISFHCERTSLSAVGDKLSYGNGSSTSNGIVMPFAGKLIAATLGVTNITGTHTSQLLVNGTANTSYQLSATGTAANVSDIKNWQSTPLAFTAGTFFNWITTVACTSANAIDVTYYVIFD